MVASASSRRGVHGRRGVDARVGVTAVLQHCADVSDRRVERDEIERLARRELDETIDLRCPSAPNSDCVDANRANERRLRPSTILNVTATWSLPRFATTVSTVACR